MPGDPASHAVGAAPPGPPPGAGASDTMVRVEPVMGTVSSLRVVVGSVAASKALQAVDDACRLLHDADDLFSTWKPDSMVSRFRRGELPPEEATAELDEVLELCRQARALSREWFDPWAMPGGFDPTGLVKGWAVDRAVGALRRAGVGGALVGSGGDLSGFGGPEPDGSWTVGVRHPHHADAVACVVRVRHAVATSGDYERGAHLVDPRTGRPACRVASATVTGPSLALADALATGLAVAGEPGLAFVAAADGYEGFVIRPDGTGVATNGFPVMAGTR